MNRAVQQILPFTNGAEEYQAENFAMITVTRDSPSRVETTSWQILF